MLCCGPVNLLGKVAAGTNDEGAIIALNSQLQTTSESNRKISYTFPNIAHTLGKVNPGNPDAIQALTKLIRFPITNRHEVSELSESIRLLGAIDLNNPEATKALIKLQQFAQSRLDDFIKRFDIKPENVDQALSELLSEYCKKFGYESKITEVVREASGIHTLFIENIKIFAEINRENTESINFLTKLLAHPEERIRFEAALSLAKVDPGNLNALNALVVIYRTAKTKYYFEFDGSLPNQLLEIRDPQRRKNLIGAITEIIETEPPSECYYIAEALAKADPGNDRAVTTLLDYLQNPLNDPLRASATRKIIKTLKATLREEQFKQIVSRFKNPLFDAESNNDTEQFEIYYELFLHCAENISYRDFFQALHYNSGFISNMKPSTHARVIAIIIAGEAWMKMSSCVSIIKRLLLFVYKRLYAVWIFIIRFLDR